MKNRTNEMLSAINELTKENETVAIIDEMISVYISSIEKVASIWQKAGDNREITDWCADQIYDCQERIESLTSVKDILQERSQ